MNEVLRPDLCVLGGGAAGQSLAVGAALWGLSVVIVERRALAADRLDAAARGRTLLSASRIVKTLRGGRELGVLTDEPRIEFRRIGERASLAALKIAPNYARARLEAMKIDVIAATGRFTRRDALEAGGRTIKARRFVIATGSEDKISPIPGLDLVHPLTCASVCDLDSPPSRLIVIGGDPHGLAVAQALRRLGAGVVVVTGGALLPELDEEFSGPVRAQFQADGIRLVEGAEVIRIEPQGDGLRVFLSGGRQEDFIEGSHLMIAAGASPLVEGLGLAAAGVRYSAEGIDVGANLRSSNRRIFAIGRAARVQQGSGAGEYHASVVLPAIIGLPARKIAPGASADVIMTDPPIAVAGLREAEARAQRKSIRIFRFPFCETDRGRIESATGHVTLICSRNGTILGGAIVGTGAEELINLLTLAISRGVNAATLATELIPYPSLADAVRRAGQQFAARRGANPATRLLLRILRKIG
ncbi:FAD-dependent oxidoreductase [Methylocapsa palsarum]|uniref:Pyruvate/2-oxoglutarate dehydrogenase complex, dihydrolipoamide dehydrogenase (E3) component n=1 Tax=Methylocapsa palsarum TaxID=1612308 RepID=A0A1I3W6S6_9HYPH|nr:FAD-dependent oxidoreductase [Methylocapsa palsarum]SFK03195.1 Pyruvate/2-oxoglutarate dehydrogenase complex, dihydrolipoamide dehydrogenase (E3) component [Methylocapsa palsarum]